MKTKTKKTPTVSGAPLFIADPLTPTALAADADNYNPAGLSGATMIRLDTGAADYSISGIATGSEGRILTIMNVGTTNSIELLNQSTSSSEANRIIGPNGQPIAIRYGGAVTLIYDGVSSRWRAMASTRF